MCAKFVPSLANMFMAHWEIEVINTDPPKELRLWRRYIDDLSLLEAFFSNQNNRGISLQYEASHSQINFLDLIIIPLSSCHHASWLKAVPKGQFQCIRCNCTEI